MKVLLVVYKIERGRGSEDGSGYGFVSGMIAQGLDLTVVTRRNNASLLAGDPLFEGVRVIGVDVPRWLGFFKRGGRGIILYYYLWQIVVGRLVRRLQREQRFDIVHQFNFHTDWAAHFLRNPGGRLIWGPVVHHERVPGDFIRHARGRMMAGEWLRAAVKSAFWHLDPFLRSAVRRTDLVIYGNARVAPPFEQARARTWFRAYASGATALEGEIAQPEQFSLLSVGRLTPLKGFDTSVDAFATFLSRNPGADATLTIIGAGPLDAPLRAEAKARGIESRVRFVPWISQAELRGFYATSAAFLFPSFEAQGLVVAEAMAAGLPVICLADTGPAFVAGDCAVVIARGPYRAVVERTADAIQTLWREYVDGAPYAQRMAAVHRHYGTRLQADRFVDETLRHYRAQVGDAQARA